jgi:hypothetical protein
VIAEAGVRFQDWASRSAQKAEQDPVAWLIGVLRKFGALALGLGVLLGVIGYYLKAASVAAMKDEIALLGSIGQVWANIKPIQYTPATMGTAPVLGSNPLQDLQNFGSDVKTDIFGVGADLSQVGQVLGTLGEDVALGVVDLAKTIFTVGVHSPQLLWNALVWVLGGGVADVVNWVYPYLIIFGAIAIGVSIGLDVARRAARWYWQTAVEPSFEEARVEWADRQRSQVWGPVTRRLFGLPAKSASRQAPAGAPPTIRAPEAPAPAGASPDASAGLPGVPPVRQNPPSSSDKYEEHAPTPPDLPPPAEPPGSAPETPIGPTREELETILGEAMTRQRDLIRAEQRAIETPTERSIADVAELAREEEAEEDALYTILAAPLLA